MRTFAIFAIALLSTVAVCQVAPVANRCPGNIKTAIAEIKQAIDNKPAKFSQKFALIERLAFLAKECAQDLEAKLSTKSLGETPECAYWRAELKRIGYESRTGKTTMTPKELFDGQWNANQQVERFCY